MSVVFIGLGSNVGSREGYLRTAVSLIVERCGAALLAESSVKETKAVDFTEQPDFLNQVVKVSTNLPPDELLKVLKNIESDIGRIHRFDKGPREIDLDILLYDDIIIEEDNLVVPHPGIMNRGFVIEHLLELDPLLADPVSKRKYVEVYRGACDNIGLK